jgi:hypothetical protein
MSDHYSEQFELERMALLDQIAGLEIENEDLREELEEVLSEITFLSAQLDYFYTQGEQNAA